MTDNYIDSDISQKALYNFIKKNVDFGNYFQCVEIYENDKMKVRYALDPYKCDNSSEVYSLSKSFTSTAIGILCDRGIISLDDKICDLFSESIPDNICTNMKKLTIRHLLTMNTGHESCTMPYIYNTDDGIKSFFEQCNKFEPGTHFTYNTGASWVLSAIVTKFSGYSLLDFLNINVFRHIGIDDVTWYYCGGRKANIGGAGIHLSADDLVKFGLLYLHEGKAPDGYTVISKEWVKQAGSFQTDNSINGQEHWGCGYGYQFWLNTFGGYRGDGAFGQLCVIIPDRHIVVALKSEGKDMGPEMKGLKEFLDTMHEVSDPSFKCYIKYDPIYEYPAAIDNDRKIYSLNENLSQFTTAELKNFDDRIEFCISDGQKLQKISAGKGKWIESRIIAKHFKPTLVGMMPTNIAEDIRMVACCGTEDGNLIIRLRSLSCPHREKITFKFEKDLLHIEFKCDRDNSLLEKESRILIGNIIK